MKNKSALKIYIDSMGCSRRMLDTSRLVNYFKLNGHQVIRRPGKADYILFTTCAFKKRQEDFAIKKIRKLKKYKGELIVGGCLPDINPKRLKTVFDGITFTPTTMDKIDQIFNSKIKFRDLPDANFPFRHSFSFSDPTHLKDYFQFNLKFLKFLFRRLKIIIEGEYYIRVNWGCLGRCSYCAIKKATGSLVSKSLERCLTEFKTGVSNGYRNFILIGEDVGAYGLDIKQTLPGLLNEFLKIKGSCKFYIWDVNPQWIVKYSDELIPVIRTGAIREIQCDIQSGSNKILRAMNRFYTAEQAESTLIDLKQAYPKLILRTDVMVGFPGETEEDFNQTLDFIKKVKFNNVVFYPYNERPGTPAINFPDKVPPEIIKERIKRGIKML